MLTNLDGPDCFNTYNPIHQSTTRDQRGAIHGPAAAPVAQGSEHKQPHCATQGAHAFQR